MTCRLCEINSPLKDFNRSCCRARFLVSLPSLRHRQGWLELWRQECQQMVLEIEAIARGLWEGRRQQALSAAKAAIGRG